MKKNVSNEKGKGKNCAIVKIWWVVKEGIKEEWQKEEKTRKAKLMIIL